jgi:hypothetical protein
MKKSCMVLLLLALFARSAPAETSDPLPIIPMDSTATEEPPLTYEASYAIALETGKPLIVWVGGAFCPNCIRDSAKDFVHHFTDSFESDATPRIVVGVVDGKDLVRAGEVGWWIVGDREFGHLPSIRTVIRTWLARRSQARDAMRASLRAATPPGYSLGSWSAGVSGTSYRSSTYMGNVRVRVTRTLPRVAPAVRFVRPFAGRSS